MNTPATGSTRRDKTRFVVPLLLITTTLLGLGVFELILSALLWYPPLVRVVPAHLGNMAVRYYDAADRAVVQGMESCAQYDSRLFYTLKPGTCVQTEREFSVAYAINSQGLRDSETALTAPRMIVIGDSFAMGWGVAQQSAFAKLVEAEWGHSVLNAGISSYGTARETSLLVTVQPCQRRAGSNDATV